MSHLRLPLGKIEQFRKRLDHRLQAIRRRVAQKHVSKTAAKEQGALIIRRHYWNVMAFVNNYLKNRKHPQRFTEKDFDTELKEAVEGWNQIVSDM